MKLSLKIQNMLNDCPTCEGKGTYFRKSVCEDKLACLKCYDWCRVLENIRMLESAEDQLRIIVANAKFIPDPTMGNSTDCYGIPLEDIEDAKNVLKEIEKKKKNRSIKTDIKSAFNRLSNAFKLC